MSGKIDLKVRKSVSKDKRYDFYPEAFLIIRGEDGSSITISPSYRDLMKILIDFRKHELKVDLTRERENYVSVLIKQVEQTLEILKQLQISDFDEIEDIYKEQDVGKWK